MSSGTSGDNSGTMKTVTLNTAFSNTNYTIVTNPLDSGSPYYASSVRSHTKSNFVVTAGWTGAGSYTGKVSWVAYGY